MFDMQSPWLTFISAKPKTLLKHGTEAVRSIFSGATELQTATKMVTYAALFLERASSTFSWSRVGQNHRPAEPERSAATSQS